MRRGKGPVMDPILEIQILKAAGDAARTCRGLRIYKCDYTEFHIVEEYVEDITLDSAIFCHHI